MHWKIVVKWLGWICILMLLSCRSDRRGSSQDPYLKEHDLYVKEVERLERLRSSDPGSRILFFCFPMELASEDIEVYLNGVEVRTTYGGERQEGYRKEGWLAQVLMKSDVEDGQILVRGKPFQFRVRLSDFKYKYYIEIYRGESTGEYVLYHGEQTRKGYI